MNIEKKWRDPQCTCSACGDALLPVLPTSWVSLHSSPSVTSVTQGENAEKPYRTTMHIDSLAALGYTRSVIGRSTIAP